jgi:hypothetical protein
MCFVQGWGGEIKYKEKIRIGVLLLLALYLLIKEPSTEIVRRVSSRGPVYKYILWESPQTHKMPLSLNGV